MSRLNVRPAMTYADLETAVRDLIRDPSRRAEGSGESSQKPQRDEWDGGYDLAGAADLLARGWEAGNVAVAHVVDLVAGDESETGGWDLDVCGDFPLIPAYVSGTPECMMRREYGPAPRRVRLVVSPTYHWQISAAQAIEYAKATAAIAAGLMARGLDVAVTGVHATDECFRAIIIKDYAADIDASALAFATHPAMLRRVLFAVSEMDAGMPRSSRDNGYGVPSYSLKRRAEYRAALGPDCVDERLVMLPELTAVPCATWEKARDAILAVIEPQLNGEEGLA